MTAFKVRGIHCTGWKTKGECKLTHREGKQKVFGLVEMECRKTQGPDRKNIGGGAVSRGADGKVTA